MKPTEAFIFNRFTAAVDQEMATFADTVGCMHADELTELRERIDQQIEINDNGVPEEDDPDAVYGFIIGQLASLGLSVSLAILGRRKLDAGDGE